MTVCVNLPFSTSMNTQNTMEKWHLGFTHFTNKKLLPVRVA